MASSTFFFFFFFSLWYDLTPSLPDHWQTLGRKVEFMPYLRSLARNEMQTVSTRIWTVDTKSIFYNDHYTTHAFYKFFLQHVTNHSSKGNFQAKKTWFWIQSFPSPKLVASSKLKNTVCPYYLPIVRGEKGWNYSFLDDISTKWNANNLIKGLDLAHQFHFLWKLMSPSTELIKITKKKQHANWKKI